MIATVVRIAAGSNELWLDEIWSYFLARNLSSPAGVFTAIHHDNNHYLNTLYLYLIPDSSRWLVYRLPAIVAGIGSVALSALIARRAGRTASLSAAVLFAGSFLMILYSTEARGYGLAVFFALAAVYAADRFTTGHRAAWGAVVAVSSILGFLAHLTFFQAYVALVAWTSYRLYRQGRGWKPLVDDLVLCHLPPATVLVWLYLVDIRRMTIGGGPEFSALDVSTGALSLALGGPGEGSLSVAVAILALTMLIISIAVVWKSGSDLWLLFGVATLVSPVMMLAATRPTYLFERYFLVSVAFFLLSLAWAASALARRRPIIAYTLLGLWVAANSVHTARLITLGRGHYMEAMRWMDEHSQRPVVTIGSDHDFRNGMVVEFYRRFLPPAPRITYLPRDRWPREGPEWLLLHSQAQDFKPPQEVGERAGTRYLFVRLYPYAELSGWNWALYKAAKGHQ